MSPVASTSLKWLFLRGLHALERTLRAIPGLQPDPSLPPQRILVTAVMGIGNALLLTPMLRQLHRRFPKAEITLLVTGSNFAETLVEHLPFVHGIARFNHKKASKIAKLRFLVSPLWRRTDMLVTNFLFPGYLHAVASLWVPRRIGPVSDLHTDRRYHFLWTAPVTLDDTQHEAELNLSLLSPLAEPDVNDAGPVMALPPGATQRAESFLDGQPEFDPRRSGKPLVILAPNVSAGQEWKRWPLEKQRALVEALHDKHDARFLIVGAPSEYETNLATFGKDRPWLIHRTQAGPLAGDLGSDAALLRYVRCFIGNDSGLAHIAAAMGTPTVMLAGPTDLRRTKPIGPQVTVVDREMVCRPCYRWYGDTRVRRCQHTACLSGLNVETVLTAVEQVLTNQQPVFSREAASSEPPSAL